VFLASNTFAMVTYRVTKIVTTCSSMVGQFFDIKIVALSDKETVVTIHQNINCGNTFV